MPKTVPNAQFPFNKDTFQITLYEEGNAPDYSVVYAPGVEPGHGYSESYTLNNAPKGQDHMQIEVTCNPDTDSTRFNYIKIDYLDRAGGDAYNKKVMYYFVNSKTILNYPSYDPITNTWGGYAVLFDCTMDVWATWINDIGSPIIHLSKVTTNDPEGWHETSVINQSILPFWDTDTYYSNRTYRNFKTIIGWQAKRPDEMESYIIDDMPTFMQFNDNGQLDDFKADLQQLASEPPESTTIYQTYTVAKAYVVLDEFATDDGGHSTSEDIECFVPDHSGYHGRLKYYPYIRGFIRTIDGQCMEVDQNKLVGKQLYYRFRCTVKHSTVPDPTSVIMPEYLGGGQGDVVIFNQYPSIDFAGRNITPIQQLTTKYADFWKKVIE